MPTFTEIGTNIGQLVEKKNAAYGNAFAESCKILEVLFPNGVPVEKYTDLLTITRILDKLFRIATDKDALGESPFGDIAGYAILALKRQQDEVEKTSQEMREMRLKIEAAEKTDRLEWQRTIHKCKVCGKEFMYSSAERSGEAENVCDPCYMKKIGQPVPAAEEQSVIDPVIDPYITAKCNDCGKQYKRHAYSVGARARTGLCDGCYVLRQKHGDIRSVMLCECTHCRQPYEGSLVDVNTRSGLCPKCASEVEARR